MDCFMRFYEDIDSNTGMRKGTHYKLQKDGTYKIEDSIIPHSNVPNFEGSINNKIYDLYPFLTKINKTAVDILGRYFHIDRLQHSLKSSEKNWYNLFDWFEKDLNNDEDDDEYKEEIYCDTRKGSYNSFLSEINSQAFGQLRILQELPRREIEIAFNILESSLKLAHKNDGRMAYNFVGKSFDLTEDKLVDYDEIVDFISPKLNEFIYNLENAELINV